MATETATTTSVEEVAIKQLEQLQIDFGNRIDSLDIDEEKEQEQDAENLADLIKWFIKSLVPIASGVGTTAGVLRTVHVNAANIERMIRNIGKATDILSKLTHLSYKLSRMIFPRGHGVRKFLLSTVKRLRNFDLSSTGAQRILGIVQICGSVVTLGFALNNLRKICQLAEDIEKTGQALTEWQSRYIKALNDRQQQAAARIRDLFTFFEEAADFTDFDHQRNFYIRLEAAACALDAYKTEIGNGRSALEKIRNEVVMEKERADMLRKSSIQIVGMGGVGTFFSVMSGGIPGVVSGVINIAATGTGVVGFVWSSNQLAEANALMVRVEREMGKIRSHTASYQELIQQLRTFQDTFRDKITKSKSALERARDAREILEEESREKDRQLAEMMAQLEAMKKKTQQMEGH